MPPQLTTNQRVITTPFGLIGNDENALSFALAYTFQQCPALLLDFLKQIGIVGIRQSYLNNATVSLQRRRSGEIDGGVTDIEIHLRGYFHVIVEAKIGFSFPTLAQCNKYLPHFRDEPQRRLVALIESPTNSFVAQYTRLSPDLEPVLLAFQWTDLIPSCIRLFHHGAVERIEKGWLRAFYRFLNEEYSMRAFTTEVWILAISTEPLWKGGKSYWDIHQKYQVWWDFRDHTVRPLYLAFRVNGVVNSISRVTTIQHDMPMIQIASELKRVEESWPHTPSTVWHFDTATPLPNPVRTGPGMYNRRVRCDLDLLLTCGSVQEIEQSMSERRQRQEE